MLAVNVLNFYKLIALSITILIVFWLVSIWNINLWQQVLLEKTAENQPLKALKTKSVVLKEQLNEQWN